MTKRGGLWNWLKISQAAAAIFAIGLIIGSAKLFLDYNAAANKLDAAKLSVENLSVELALKKNLDENISALRKINERAAQVETTENFNRLLNLGRVADKNIRLTKIRVEENSLELEGSADDAAAIKNYLDKVKSNVANSARLESSAERNDEEISFVIRASLK